MSENNSFFKKQLTDLENKGLTRQLSVIEGAQGPWVVIDGKNILNLCSNNYLGLASDKRLKKTSIKTIKDFGIGSGASRLICGNQKLHEQLEDAVAKFKQTEKALLFNSGFNANLGIIPSLVGGDDIVFSDRLNHASVVDGILLSRAVLRRYPHKDISRLKSLLEEEGKNFKKRLIVSDTVFSMDGDIAPLPELLKLAQEHDCFLMIDEAHATGVLGENGRGALEHFNIKPNGRIIQMGTLSKALGSFGAYACGSKDLINYLINKARSLIYTTALPAAVAAASIESLKIIQQDGSLRQRLWQNAKFFKSSLKDLGFDTGETQTQIIPLIVKDTQLTMRFSKLLLKEGIFVQGIRPPTVPPGEARLRIAVIATHTKKDLAFALDKFKAVGKELNFI